MRTVQDIEKEIEQRQKEISEIKSNSCTEAVEQAINEYRNETGHFPVRIEMSRTTQERLTVELDWRLFGIRGDYKSIYNRDMSLVKKVSHDVPVFLNSSLQGRTFILFPIKKARQLVVDLAEQNGRTEREESYKLLYGGIGKKEELETLFPAAIKENP
ncbi:MAG: hypothetical protein PQJ59_16830 [Spirochaetales bacterium]|nr:hypothetical protein [Spirochaetales bacterium]